MVAATSTILSELKLTWLTFFATVASGPAVSPHRCRW